MKRILVVTITLFIVLGACGRSVTSNLKGGASAASVSNETDHGATVYVAFGSDSGITAPTWKSFCTPNGALNCSFPLGAHATQTLPLAGLYLNATFSFNLPVGCNTTKAELNINNPKWYDIADVSLVDGFSNKIQITMTEALDASPPTVLGPPLGSGGNEKVFGLFPFGCDICVARQNPPCGTPVGKTGCKGGTQYNPDVPCQYQGTTLGGGSMANVALVK